MSGDYITFWGTTEVSTENELTRTNAPLSAQQHVSLPPFLTNHHYSLADSSITKQGLNIGKLYMTNIKREIRGDWHSRYLITCIMGIMLDYLSIYRANPLLLLLTLVCSSIKMGGIIFNPCYIYSSYNHLQVGQHFGSCMIVPSTAAS